MYDCSKELLKFYDKHVKLSAEDQKKLADYRDTNIDRVKKGLKDSAKPSPIKFINQGSYAMDTIIQHPENDYDLDIGIQFNKVDLVGPKGGEYSAKEARDMVCEAVQDKRFNKAPEVRLKCVRIYYNEGYHIDMPIYREYENALKETIIEIAGSDWEETNPEAVTKWFSDAVINKSPDTSNGRQMRRIVRLIKCWAQNKVSNKPSGFIISKLVDEKYISADGRDDESLYKTLSAIYNRLMYDKNVYHPVLNGTLISEGKEKAVKSMYERLESSLKILDDLNDANCTKQTALKAWKKFFGHDYFDSLIKEYSDSLISVASVVPSSPVEKQGGERFA